ncbi:DUF167 domain-containing protein [bacterium]|nr:DUF167 domain-containing protein [bacterium]
MKIAVAVKTNARHEKVEKLSDTQYKVSVNAPPVEGRANEAIIKILSRYFNIAPSKIVLLKGQASKNKIFEVLAA